MFINQQVCKDIGLELVSPNGYAIIKGLFGSWIIALLLGNCIVKNLIECLRKTAEKNFTSRKEEYTTFPKGWEYWVTDTGLGKWNAWLGAFEITFYFICLLFNKPEGIGAWLAFKVAAKWESWTNIVKFNEKLENKDDFEYLKLRNNLATSVLQRFLIGTILNILIAFIGIVIFFIVRTSIITQELNKNLGFIKGAIFIILGICILIEIVLFFSRKRCEKCPKKIVN